MILTDTGPLVAMIDGKDMHHGRITELIENMDDVFVTTEACLTECLYLLHSVAGWRGQLALWNLISAGELQILPSAHDGPSRSRVHMERFLDQPCDYADATLLGAAEDLQHRRIFTTDRHFYAYRLTTGMALEVVR